MDGARGGEYYILKPRWSSVKIRPWQRDLFLKISVYISSEGSAKQRWVGRVANLGCSVAQKGAE